MNNLVSSAVKTAGAGRRTTQLQQARGAGDEPPVQGEAYLTHTTVNGWYAARLAIGAIRTDRQHVEALWRSLTSRL